MEKSPPVSGLFLFHPLSNSLNSTEDWLRILLRETNMRKRFLFFLLPLLFSLLSGCAHVISKDLREQVDRSLTFRDVFQNPNAYQGKMVIWGGDIVKTTNQKDGTTFVEVFQLPLSRREEPNDTSPSDGRFLIFAEKYLDPYLFRRGKKITVAGEILGEKTMALGEMDYRYPLVSSKQIYLWREYYYYPAPHYYPYSPYYYYDPWWDYPYPWRFRYYYYRRF
jgi:outer membrane lipoprotein